MLQLILDSTHGDPFSTNIMLDSLLKEQKVKVEADNTLTVSDSEQIKKVIKDNEVGSQTAIMDKLEALDETSKMILKAASVFEEHFSCDTVTELLPFAMKRDKKVPQVSE